MICERLMRMAQLRYVAAEAEQHVPLSSVRLSVAEGGHVIVRSFV